MVGEPEPPRVASFFFFFFPRKRQSIEGTQWYGWLEQDFSDKTQQFSFTIVGFCICAVDEQVLAGRARYVACRGHWCCRCRNSLHDSAHILALVFFVKMRQKPMKVRQVHVRQCFARLSFSFYKHQGKTNTHTYKKQQRDKMRLLVVTLNLY